MLISLYNLKYVYKSKGQITFLQKFVGYKICLKLLCYVLTWFWPPNSINRICILTAVNMNITVFWVVTPCSQVEFYQHFGGFFYLHHQGQTTFRYSTEEILISKHVFKNKFWIDRRILQTRVYKHWWFIFFCNLWTEDYRIRKSGLYL